MKKDGIQTRNRKVSQKSKKRKSEFETEYVRHTLDKFSNFSPPNITPVMGPPVMHAGYMSSYLTPSSYRLPNSSQASSSSGCMSSRFPPQPNAFPFHPGAHTPAHHTFGAPFNGGHTHPHHMTL